MCLRHTRKWFFVLKLAQQLYASKSKHKVPDLAP